MTTLSRYSSQDRPVAFRIGLLLLFLGSLLTEAWVSQAPSSLGFKSRSSNAAMDSFAQQPRLRCSKAVAKTALFYSSEFDRNEISNSTDSASSSPIAPTSSVVERLRVNGVSVSPKGFHVLLESTKGGGKDKNTPETTASTTKNSSEEQVQTKDENVTTNAQNPPSSSTVLPLKMTNDPADAYAATSPESLTLCQLLSGVDMAGAILPPELLGRIVACHIEDKIETLYDDDDEEEEEEMRPSIFTPVLTPIEGKIWQYLQAQQALLREQNIFGSTDPKKDTSSSSTPMAQMPQVTLDQLTLVPSRKGWKCKLECALPEWKENIVVEIKADLLTSLAYNYDPESSLLFTCVALALRYKAPIVLEQPSDVQQQQQQKDENNYYWSNSDDLDRDFPQRTTLENLQQQSTRVTQNIEKGFEIHKLTGALQIAMRLGDTKAAEKIRAKLDEYDSMEDLPTLGSDKAKDDGSSFSSSSEKSDDRLDDLENNILQ